MSKTNTEGGAAIEGNVKVGKGDFVGRDQTIHNIVLVGGFLDFAKLKNLIPKPPSATQYKSVEEAYKKALSRPFDNKLIEAVSFAGEILDGVFTYEPKSKQAFNIKTFIAGLAGPIVTRLKKSGHWDIYITDLYETNDAIELESTNDLWLEHYGADRIYYLYGRGRGKFVTLESGYYSKNPSTSALSYPFEVDFQSFETTACQVFLAGVVLDLIRIKAEETNSLQLIESLTKIFKPKG